MFGRLSTLAMISAALAAGLGYFSFWWVLIPTFLAGTLALSNGRHYAAVISANQRGSMALFPQMLAIYCGSYLAAAGAIYWVGTLLQ